jgi:tRNA A37 methylthiotransferase MiaB
MRERLEELTDFQRSIALDRNLEHVGGARTVLVDEVLDGEDDPDFGAVGRTEGQALEVDGVTNLILESGVTVRPGDFVRAEVVDASDYDLVARVIAS